MHHQYGNGHTLNFCLPTCQSLARPAGSAIRKKTIIAPLLFGTLVVGIAGALLCAIGFFVAGPFQFYRSYLWSYVLLVGLSVGSLAWLMLQYLTGGAWGECPWAVTPKP